MARLEEDAKARAAEGVPGYVLLRELGRGGMGVVHEARHVKLNRVVALKMMLGGGQASRGELIRFLAEAEAVAAIRHENVVQVYDYGEADGRPFMALEFCPGGTLGKLLPKNPESATAPRDMAALIAKIARGVAAAHALGIVHRDLKPGNVFLDESGTPKVADFGLAKRGEGADVTQAGVGMGTPSYMAPEQARDAKFVGPQADVWALGVTLYEALTGTRPFTGTVPEILAKAQSAEPVPPRKVVSTVPRDLELICLKCLVKQPHERYATAKELADDLDRYHRNEPIGIRPAGPLERGYKWVKRNKVVSGAAATVFLALLAGAGVSLGFGLEANEQAENARNQKKEAEDAADGEKAAADRANGEARRADRERNAAVNARNDLETANGELIRSRDRVNRALAEALLGPVGGSKRDESLTPYEVETFWRITGLRREDVSLMVLEEATRGHLGCRQLQRRPGHVIHAVCGLDRKRREAVDELFRSRLNEPSIRGPQAITLAEVVSGGNYLSPKTAATVSRLLIDELAGGSNPSASTRLRFGLAEAVSEATAWMESGEASAALRDALGKTRVPEERALLARRLAEEASGLEAAEASTVCTQAALVITRALELAPSPYDRHYLAGALYALSARMDPAEAAKLCARAARALTKVLPRQKEYGGVRGRLAWSFAAVVARVEPAEARSVYAQAAQAVADVLVKRTDPYDQGALAEDLVVLTARMPADDAARVCGQAAPVLADTLAKISRPRDRGYLAKNLGALAARMESGEAAKVCRQAVQILGDALATETSDYERLFLAEGLAAAAAGMEPTEAARTLVEGLGKVKDSGTYGHLARGLARVAVRMRPAEAAKVCTQAAHALLRTIAADPLANRSVLLESLAALAARMEPAEASNVCAQATRVLLDALAGTTDTSKSRELAMGLVGVLPFLKPTEASNALKNALIKNGQSPASELLATHLIEAVARLAPTEAAGTLVEVLAKTKDARTRGDLARGLARIAARMEPAEASEVCTQAARTLLDAITEADTSGCGDLAQGLGAVAGWMTPAEASKVCTQASAVLLSALAKARNLGLHRSLALGLSGVAARMDSATASKVCTQAASRILDDLVTSNNFYDRSFIAEALCSVVVWTEPADASKARTRAASILLSALTGEGDPDEPERRAVGFAAVTLGSPREISARAEHGAALIASFATPATVLPSLVLLHPRFDPLPPLPPQDLVELLKHPFCIAGARRTVLDALEFTYNRPFRDQWVFVEYAQKHQPHLDLLTPPKRPTQP